MVKKFKLYEVKPNVEALKAFREEYIKTFKGSPLCKILSRTDKWYKSKSDIYNPSVLSLGIAPLGKIEMERNKKIVDVEGFIKYGAINVNQVRAINVKKESSVKLYKPQVDYFYLFEGPMSKGSKINGYFTYALKLNQDLYNLFMIQYRRFSYTDTPHDLSRYQDYFTVLDNPYATYQFSEERLEDFYRCSMMSEKDIENMIRNFEIEEEAVMSLRKK